MKKTDLLKLTVEELKALARKIKVSLAARMKKAEIVEALAAGMKKEKPAKKAAARKKAAAAKAVVKKAAPDKGASPTKRPAAKKSAAAAKNAAVPRAAEPAAKTLKKPADLPLREWKIPPRIEEPLLEQERVAEAKYFTGMARRQQAPAGDLPLSYHVDRIVLMARDPFVMYAYWEANPERLDREKAWFGWDSKLCLRIYDVTGVRFDGRNALGYFDQDVYERAGNWYFDLNRPSHAFCADLGLLGPSGRFLTLARSNFVTMPRDGVSDAVDEEWMLVDDDFWKLYGSAEGFKRGLSSREMQEGVKQRQRRLHAISSPGLFSPGARVKR